MLAPDYQEFANRGAPSRPWQYRDLGRLHVDNTRKTQSVARLPRR